MIDETSKLEAIIFDTVHRLSSNLSRKYDQLLLERYGIGFSQYKIMHLLQNNEAMKQSSIATILGQTEASISRQVQIMVGYGFAIVTVNKLDKREHLVCITSKGLRLINEADKVISQKTSQIFKDIGHKQKIQLITALQAIDIN